MYLTLYLCPLTLKTFELTKPDTQALKSTSDFSTSLGMSQPASLFLPLILPGVPPPPTLPGVIDDFM